MSLQLDQRISLCHSELLTIDFITLQTSTTEQLKELVTAQGFDFNYCMFSKKTKNAIFWEKMKLPASK